MAERNVTDSGEVSSARDTAEMGQHSEGARLWREVLEQPAGLRSGGIREQQAGAETPQPDAAEAATPGPSLAAVDEPRERLSEVLRTLTVGVALAGLPVVVGAAYADFVAGRFFLLALWLLIYVPLLVPLVALRISYSLHVGIFVGFLWGVGLLSFFQPNYQSLAPGVLLFLPAFAGLLLGGRSGLFLLLGAIVTMGIGLGVTGSGLLGSVTGEDNGLISAAGPVIMLAFLLLLAGGLVLVARRLHQHLTSADEHRRELVADLEDLEGFVAVRSEEIARQADRWEAIEALAELGGSPISIDGIVDPILGIVSDHVTCSVARIFTPDRTRSRLCLRTSIDSAQTGYQDDAPCIPLANGGIVGWVADSQEPYVTLDAQSDELYAPVLGVSGTLSEAAFPLMVDQRLVGVLDVHADERDAFSQADVELLSVVSDWTALVLDQRQLAAVPAAAVDALSRASGRLCAAAAKGDVVDAIIDTVAETRAGTCLVAEYLRRPDGTLDSLLCLGAWRRHGPARPAPGTRLPLSSAVFPIEVLDGTWRVPDVASEERLSWRARDLFDAMGVRALVGFPLKGRTGRFGHVLVLYGDPGSFSTSTLQLYEVLEHQAGLALERATRLDEAYGQARRSQLMAQATTRLHESLDVEGVLSTAAVDIGRTLGLAALDVRLGLSPHDAEGEKTSRAEGSESESETARGEED